MTSSHLMLKHLLMLYSLEILYLRFPLLLNLCIVIYFPLGGLRSKFCYIVTFLDGSSFSLFVDSFFCIE
jgi:hypothetical protein